MAVKYNQFTVDMGKRIFLCRKKLGMTQEELAEKMEVSTQTISYAEQGSKAMRPENLVKLSRILGVTTDYLLTGLFFRLTIFYHMHEQTRNNCFCMENIRPIPQTILTAPANTPDTSRLPR